jgi:hypothetical protein
MTQLTLNPDNQIAFLGGVENLIVGTEYDITATHLRPGTRFVFKGRPDIALTKRPDGVPTRYTPVDAQITVVPPAVAPSVALPVEVYPFDVKDRLTAFGLNSSFLPIVGGTLTAGLTIENGNLNLGASLSINPDPTFAYITRQNQTVGHRRIGITGRSTPGFTEYPLEELRINASLTTCTGAATFTGDVTVNTLNTTGGGIQVYGHVNLRIPATSPDKTIAYLARTNQTAGFRRIGITARDLPETYYPLEELWINATATNFTGSGTFTGDVVVKTLDTTGGGIQVYGHLNLRTPVTSTDKTIGYLARTNQLVGFRRIGITGRDLPDTYYPLEELWINATVTTITGRADITGGGLTVSGAVAIGGAVSLSGAITTSSAITVNSGGLILNGGAGLTINDGGGANISGPIFVGGDAAFGGDITGHTLIMNGGITVNDGGVDIVNGGFYVGNGGVTHLTGPTVTDDYIRCDAGRIVSRYSGSPSVSVFDTTTAIGFGMWGTGQSLYLGTTDYLGVPTNGLLRLIGAPFYDVIPYADFYPDVDGYRYLGSAGVSAWLSVYAYGYVTVSDPAVKHDIRPVPTNCLSLVLTVEPKTYKLITTRDVETERIHWGFLAPDIADAAERAGYEFGGVREDKGVMGLAYNDMLAVLWGAVRELTVQVSELQSKLGGVSAQS